MFMGLTSLLQINVISSTNGASFSVLSFSSHTREEGGGVNYGEIN